MKKSHSIGSEILTTYTIKDLLDGNVPNDNLIGTCPICNEPNSCIEMWKHVGIGCTECLEKMENKWNAETTQ
jgi:hypothetical protein